MTAASISPGDERWAVGLNAEQDAAVRSDAERLLVIAGAGTGKTKTLVSRVARLIDDGVPPERILLLTFTRRAAAEMLRRVGALDEHRGVGSYACEVPPVSQIALVEPVRAYRRLVGLNPASSPGPC